VYNYARTGDGLPIDEAVEMYEVICELALEHDIDIDAPGFEKEF
jgi:hypothetical protein